MRLCRFVGMGMGMGFGFLWFYCKGERDCYCYCYCIVVFVRWIGRWMVWDLGFRTRTRGCLLRIHTIVVLVWYGIDIDVAMFPRREFKGKSKWFEYEGGFYGI